MRTNNSSNKKHKYDIVAAKEFAGVFLGTKSTAPIKWENHVIGMLLMPIRVDTFRQDIERIQKAKIW